MSINSNSKAPFKVKSPLEEAAARLPRPRPPPGARICLFRHCGLLLHLVVVAVVVPAMLRMMMMVMMAVSTTVNIVICSIPTAISLSPTTLSILPTVFSLS